MSHVNQSLYPKMFAIIKIGYDRNVEPPDISSFQTCIAYAYSRKMYYRTECIMKM